MKKSSLLLLSMLLLFAVFLVACGGGDTESPANEGNEPADDGNGDEGTEKDSDEPAGEPQQGGSITYGSTGEPTMFNTLYTHDSASTDVETLIYDQLLVLNHEVDVEPQLAEDWEVSEDGLTYTFYLKEGVKFHDGEEFTAEDVKFTYDIFLHEDYTGARGSDFIDLAEVNVIDDYTVEFVLDEINPGFYSNFTYGILPKHILEDVPVADLEEHEFNRDKPIGTGPFKFVEWADGQYTQVEAFEDYHGEGPYLDSITIKYVTENSALVAQYEAGDVDYMKVVATNIETFREWEANGDLKLEETISHGYSWLGFNQRLDMFADKETRQAITHALDRDKIIEGVVMGRGETAHAPASPLSWAYPDDVPTFEYDPEKAKQLLADAGWEEGADGILERDGERFSFELKTNQGNEVREDLIVVIQSQLADVGIEVNPQVVEWSSFMDQMENRDFEAVVLGWNLSADPDPRAIWHSDSAEKDLNEIGYSNEEVDALIEQQERTADEDERQELLQEIMRLIADDQGYTFLFHDLDDFALPTNLHGYTPHPRANTYKANEWWLDQDEE